jgi:carboxypeptidase Taq
MATIVGGSGNGPHAAYAGLLERFRTRALLTSIEGVLQWDEETNLPPRGTPHRAAQLAYLAGAAHALVVAPEVAGWIDEVAGSALVDDPRSVEAVNVREWRRLVGRQRRLDRALVEETARLVSVAQAAWVDARRANDFASFRPHLEAVVAAKRREAAALAEGGATPYDALLDEYEQGMTAARLEALFSPMARALAELVDRVRGVTWRPRVELLARPVDKEAQVRASLWLAEALGYDLAAGRIDTSAHPFSTHLGPGDTRITTRFYDDDWSEGWYGTMHEVGHALYDQGLPPEHFGTPRGDAASYGVHESQSRLWENFVGRSLGFWRFAVERLRSEWPGIFDDTGPEELHGAVNAVEPSLIRTSADEVTYNLHVVARFELERALIAGDLAVRDLPGAWSEAYQRHLGVRPPDDRDGCMQDGHWGAGLFGYFPTYALGNMIAAQLYAAAERALGPLEPRFERGNFAPLLGWLRANVHALGKTLRTDELVAEVTGSPVDAGPLLAALERKVDALYGA